MLTHRVALITGASRGIGASISKKLFQEGAKLALVARSGGENTTTRGLQGNLEEIKYDILDHYISQTSPGRGGVVERSPRDIQLYPTDLCDANQVAKTYSQVMEEFGKIDYVIHNAGALHWKHMLDVPIQRYDVLHGVNARATYHLSQLCLEQMMSNDFGHIIMHSPPFTPEYVDKMLNSSWMKNRVAYTSSKLGMSITAMAMAKELQDHNIGVNTIWPKTAIQTAATENHGLGGPAFWRTPDIIADAIFEMLKEDPMTFSGQSVIDEDYLKTKGIHDFSTYNCVKNSDPPALDDLIGA